jgi:hypothetical protein
LEAGPHADCACPASSLAAAETNRSMLVRAAPTHHPRRARVIDGKLDVIFRWWSGRPAREPDQHESHEVIANRANECSAASRRRNRFIPTITSIRPVVNDCSDRDASRRQSPISFRRRRIAPCAAHEGKGLRQSSRSAHPYPGRNAADAGARIFRLPRRSSGIARLHVAVKDSSLAQGGTAVGTGLNRAKFCGCCEHVAKIRYFTSAANKFEALASMTPMCWCMARYSVATGLFRSPTTSASWALARVPVSAN